MSAQTTDLVLVGEADRALAIDGELILGRSVEGPGRFEGDTEMSRRHARIARGMDGRLVIVDLGSANGTYVNGARLSEARTLRAGDVIRLGHTELAIRAGDEAGPLDGEALATPPPPGATSTVRGPAPITEQTPSADVPTGDRPAPPTGPLAQRSVGVATLLHAGERVPLPNTGVMVGRAEDARIRIHSEEASRHHARFDVADGGQYVTDLGSTNGTYLNGQRLHGESRWLVSGDTVTIGGEQIRFLAGEATQFGGQIPEGLTGGAQAVKFNGSHLTIGRDPTNDVVLADPNVSRFHAEVVAASGGYELRDLGSRNGTRLNGRLVERSQTIQTGSEIGVGSFRLIFDGAAFVARDDRGALRLAAEQLIVDVRGKRILDDATIDVQPGQFVAIIGESGSGKTTLIKALAGVSMPTEGRVMINGEAVSSRLSEIGYVPQDEIVHHDLSVREALTYASRLRLPQDSSDEEIKAAVHEVLNELSLVEHADTRVGSLSGGQRKRAGVGTELVNRPGLLFLDEATTGLDPGLERRMMQLMRELADNARAVITITHATKNLGLCDKVIVMGRGGHLCFFGDPADALRFFDVVDYDGIYEALETQGAPDWRQRWLAEQADGTSFARTEQAALQPIAGRPQRERRALPQAAILAGRYARLTVRDRRNLLILLGQVPILGFLIAVMFHSDTLTIGAPRESNSAVELIFLLVIVAIWVGSIDATREIIKERTVFTRERDVGVRTSAYLLSKVSILFALAAIQTLILCAVVFGLRRLDAPVSSYIEVVALLVFTSWAAVALGLVLSAFVNTENQAMSFLPLALIPQLLFAGQLKPIAQLPGILRGISTIIFARWSFAGLGGTLHFYLRFAADPLRQPDLYGPSFFRLGFGPAIGILAGFIAVFTALAAIGLHRGRVRAV